MSQKIKFEIYNNDPLHTQRKGLRFSYVSENGDEDTVAWLDCGSDHPGDIMACYLRAIITPEQAKNNLEKKEQLGALLEYLWSNECIEDLNNFSLETFHTNHFSDIPKNCRTIEYFHDNLYSAESGKKCNIYLYLFNCGKDGPDRITPPIPLVKDMNHNDLVKFIQATEEYQSKIDCLCVTTKNRISDYQNEKE